MNAPAFDTSQNPVAQFELKLRRDRGVRFRVDFDEEEHPPLWVDEPQPLGKGTAPNATRLLAAAIGDCLAGGLLLTLKKAGVEPESLGGSVHVELVRNAAQKLRIGHVRVKLDPKVAPKDAAALKACLATFEDFCTVTQSVRDGIDIEVVTS